jgi:hypothetical protein
LQAAALIPKLSPAERLGARQGQNGRLNVGWVIIHWFELGTLVLLCLNLWFVSSVLNALRETNRWLSFLTRVRWDETQGSAGSPKE